MRHSEFQNIASTALNFLVLTYSTGQSVYWPTSSYCARIWASYAIFAMFLQLHVIGYCFKSVFICTHNFPLWPVQGASSSCKPVLQGHVHQSSGGVSPHRDSAGGSDTICHGDCHPVCVLRGGRAVSGNGRGSICGRQSPSGYATTRPVLQVKSYLWLNVVSG